MKRRLIVLLLSCAFWASLVPVITIHASALNYVTIPNGEYSLSPMCAQGARLDVTNARKSNRTNIQIWAANGNTAQNFTFSHVGDGWYKIIANVSGKALDLQDGNSTSGTNVQQFTDNGTDAQRWCLLDAGDGYYYIVPKKNTNLRLDVYGASDVNGSNVQVWNANEGTAQKWKLIPLNEQSSSVEQSTNQGQTTALGSEIVSYAKKWVGTPYVWGGTDLSSGVDCSGFVCRVYEHFGINLWGRRTGFRNLVNDGLAVEIGTDLSKAQPGDIVTCNNGAHVVIYAGNNRVVQASSNHGVCESPATDAWLGKVISIIRLNAVSGKASIVAGTTSKPVCAVNGQDVTVSWDYDGGGTSVDVYLVVSPWGWENVKYKGTTTDSSYTFRNVEPGGYAAFTIVRPNNDRVQSEWTDLSVSASSFPIIPAPTLKSITHADTSPNLTLSWNYVDNADHYDIRIYKDGDLFVYKFCISGNTCDFDLAPGAYTANVAAVNATYQNWTYSTDITFQVAAHTVHNWGAGNVSLEPTYTSVGESVYTCTVCGETKTEIIPALKPELEPEPQPEREITIVSGGTHPDPSGGWAHYSVQNVDVDGARVVFQMYALKDADGYDTNFVKIRDVAQVINGSSAQFNVDYDGDVILTTKSAYVPNGSEMRTPFTGGRSYTIPSGITRIDGGITHMDSIQLVDDGGGGYTYYKLRDLGKALGFNVSWSAQRGVYIETDRPYQD